MEVSPIEISGTTMSWDRSYMLDSAKMNLAPVKMLWAMALAHIYLLVSLIDSAVLISR